MLKRPQHSFAISDEDFATAVSLAIELAKETSRPKYQDLIKTIKDTCKFTLLDAKSVVDEAIGSIDPENLSRVNHEP